MPRKYRPPATKRRKPRKTLPHTFEAAPEPEEDAGTELGASAEELDEEDWTRETVVQTAEEGGGRQTSRHLVKDYSYVQGEVLRILALATFITVSLLVTALLRN